MSSIKPIDKELIVRAAKETGAIVCAGEHNIIGGLGSAVAEVISESFPVPVLRVGMNDVFGRSGQPDELPEYHKLTPGNRYVIMLNHIHLIIIITVDEELRAIHESPLRVFSADLCYNGIGDENG